MFLMLAVALVPIFFGLLLGYFAGIRGIIDNVNVRSLVSFVMNFALPCALFLAIIKAPRAMLFSQGKLIVLLAVIYLLLYAATHFFNRFVLRNSPADGAVLALTIAFPNLTAVGIPLLDTVYGPQTAVTVAIGIAVGAMTISPLTLSILENSTIAGHEITPSVRLRRAIIRAIRRPVVWAPAAGLVAVLFNLSLPDYVLRSLTVMGSATAGCALFITGLIVSAQKFTLDWRVLVAVLAKNILQPLLCLGLALAASLPVDQTRSVVLLAAIPCGFFGLVFGKGFNASPMVASSSLILSYGLGVLTLAGWIVLLGNLH
jgi:predicted permease